MAAQLGAPQIIKRLRQCVPTILHQRPVHLAYVYGSVAAGCLTPFSDVDIALVLSPDCALDAYQRFNMELEIAVEIENRCGIRNVDVRSIDTAPLRVQGLVLTKGMLLYSREESFRTAYKVRTRKRYFDFQPVLSMMRQAYFERLEADLRQRELYG